MFPTQQVNNYSTRFMDKIGKKLNVGGRPKGSKNRRKSGLTETKEKRSGHQWKAKERLILAKAWASQTANLIQTDGTLWKGIETYCCEVHGMYRSKDSIGCKWT